MCDYGKELGVLTAVELLRKECFAIRIFLVTVSCGLQEGWI